MSCGRRVLALAAWIAAAWPGGAQPFTHISGLILDPSQSGVPGALITLVNEETGFRRTALSRRGGDYAVASLHPGRYKISVRKEGFRTAIRFGVKLDVSKPARVDFELDLGSIREEVTVEGSPPALNTGDASLGTLVGREEIERLPLNGRGLLSLIELAPGAVATPATRGDAGQFTANGQRQNANYFLVDGVSANSGASAGGLPAQSTGGALPVMTAFGSLHSLAPLESLAEFRVLTSSAAPEFGRMPGAQVSLSSRSGTNGFRAEALGYFRPEALEANDWFANRGGLDAERPRLAHFGANAGGPLRKDRTFAFAAYEGLRLRQPFVLRAPVPARDSADAGAAQEWTTRVLDLFPAPNGPALAQDLAEWNGRRRRPASFDSGSVRADHAFSDAITFFGRYSQAPSSSEYGAFQAARLDMQSRAATFGVNVRPASPLILDSRWNFSRARISSSWRFDSGASTPECWMEPVALRLLGAAGLCQRFVRVSIAGVGQVALGEEGGSAQSQFQFVQTASVNLASHSARFGLDYRRLSPQRRQPGGTLSVLADTPADLVSARNLWIASSPAYESESVLSELSLFAQDSWRLGRRVTATYGLRWEYSPPPAADGPQYFFDPGGPNIAPAKREIWRRRYAYLAPRGGLAWQASADGKTVVRAGAGIYYDSSFSIATDLVNGGPLHVAQWASGRQAPFSMQMSYGFMPDLRLPRVKHWSASVERELPGGAALSLAYTGSAGRNLMRREMGGPGTNNALWVALATNYGASDYHALQAQYRRRMSRGLQALVSYNWSHSIDNSSSDYALHWAGPGAERERDRASSDFDVRHSLSAAFSFDPGALAAGARRATWLQGWALDGMFRARSGFPVNVLANDHYTGVNFVNVFRPDVAGAPAWVEDPRAPGGRRLNRAAFRAPGGPWQGSLGRNALAGFGMSQLDVALRRTFALGESRALQFRIEAFNALNHPNFADPARHLVNPLFGEAPSMLNLMLGSGSPASGLAPGLQSGGARSIQLGFRLRF